MNTVNNTVNNTEDILDSRDVMARIEELKEEITASADATELEDELTNLEAFAAEGEMRSPAWNHGEIIIRDSYFQDFAKQYAEDLGWVTHVD